jgi:hypothetical protein
LRKSKRPAWPNKRSQDMKHTQCAKRQGDLLVDELKKRGMTIGEMEALRISTCPWKRVRECIPEGYVLDTSKRRGRLVVYRIVRKARG